MPLLICSLRRVLSYDPPSHSNVLKYHRPVTFRFNTSMPLLICSLRRVLSYDPPSHSNVLKYQLTCRSSTHLPRHVFSAWKEKVWVEEKTKNMRRAACSAGEGMKENLPKQVHLAMPVEVMSFDLDDTLWSTKGVISAANSALQSHLEENHPVLVEGVAVYNLMKEIWKEKRAEDPKLGKDPINLTELRKAGLRRACDLAGEDPRAIVEPSFKLWWQERHNVERHLFPGVLETLSALKARGVRLIAITNGNADTDHIDCLKDFFEFCVMAEQSLHPRCNEKVGERKPGLGPFMEAVRRAGYASVNDVGAEWVHVGDDITSDCVGAKGMQMRTILVSPPGGASWPAAEDVGVTELVSPDVVDVEANCISDIPGLVDKWMHEHFER